ncbi:CLUMA_CG007882, isoform E [Clunio marinus]|uniref:CLUMA_CG007882, isoform E n=1 Tax=Clunio marinus TaxID=568069 RepID=A0A1J1I7H8_9DIPT|nr:CLUMA_CG007882, isoform E [Clunio marinus]
MKTNHRNFVSYLADSSSSSEFIISSQDKSLQNLAFFYSKIHQKLYFNINCQLHFLFIIINFSLVQSFIVIGNNHESVIKK